MYAKLVKDTFLKSYKRPISKWIMLILGCLFFVPVYFIYSTRKKENEYGKITGQVKDKFINSGSYEQLKAEVNEQIKTKIEFFGKATTGQDIKKEKERILNERTDEQIRIIMRQKHPNVKNLTFDKVAAEYMDKPVCLLLFTLIGLPAALFILLMSNPYVKYIVERLVMMLFVIFGVTFLVFTILHLSPMDPAVNILGDLATEDQVVSFREAYGLDQPYLVQLLNSFKGLVTFDFGKSYLGNEDVVTALMNRFPVTLQFTFYSLLLAVIIAIPSGIVSALKPYSAIDYAVMLLALIGLSIPGFWLGLLLILNFSINLKWLPATFVVGTWKSFVMPAIVMGTGLAASVARMTRSSMLEVIHQDYIVTAKAKGLSKSKVVIRHALGNAMIPIVTVIGIQFGSMLGGAAVTEKVFNMNGIGSFIVDKQFIPDIPVVLAGVVYVAIVVSFANLFVDILYVFLDPRIKAKMKQG